MDGICDFNMVEHCIKEYAACLHIALTICLMHQAFLNCVWVFVLVSIELKIIFVYNCDLKKFNIAILGRKICITL